MTTPLTMVTPKTNKRSERSESTDRSHPKLMNGPSHVAEFKISDVSFLYTQSSAKKDAADCGSSSSDVKALKRLSGVMKVEMKRIAKRPSPAPQRKCRRWVK